MFVSLYIRYEVNFQNGIDCGGAYIKLLSDSPNVDLVSVFTFKEMMPEHVGSRDFFPR